MKKQRFAALTTAYSGKDTEIPLCEYPRPALKRMSYLCLNGEWEINSAYYSGKITVPYPPESRLSGVGKSIGESYEYKRSFTLPQGFSEGRVLLHFGAVYAECRVFLNGVLLGSHIGGYLPFSFDITNLLAEGENILAVKVTDRLDSDLPYGKQSAKRGGMWYTPISGIWQTVWIESVKDKYIEEIKITPSLDSVRIETHGGEASKRLTLIGGGEYEYEGDEIVLKIDEPKLWTPEEPNIYRFKIECGGDLVESYFALRTVESRGGELYLNGKPYLFNGALIQGYYPEGIYTPSDYRVIEDDVLAAKRLGFNMLRMHAKLECPRFYYYCDIHGVAVMQDLVNSGRYSFFLDTALPTLGLKDLPRRGVSPKRRAQFEADAKNTIKFLHSYPSIFAYTIFNEGWGQYDGAAVYKLCRQTDPTRIYDTASGWFKESETDLDSRHIYFKRISLKKGDKPLGITEFGGYSYRVFGHSYNLDKNYGYKIYSDRRSFEDGILGLYLTEAADAVRKGACLLVLTQLYDVEDETNGLLTYDRQVQKLGEESASKIKSALENAFSEYTNDMEKRHINEEVK